MSLLRTLRSKGYDAHLEDLTVVLTVKPGVDTSKAEAWARANEQGIRSELVSEVREFCGLPPLRTGANGRLAPVRGEDGEVVKGAVTVRIRVEEEPLDG